MLGDSTNNINLSILIFTPHLFHTDTNTIQTFQNTQKENSHGELKNYTIEVMEAELLGKY